MQAQTSEEIRVAYSSWRGENFAHFYVDTGSIYDRKTLCGKPALGWETDDRHQINTADCAVCNRALAKMERA